MTDEQNRALMQVLEERGWEWVEATPLGYGERIEFTAGRGDERYSASMSPGGTIYNEKEWTAWQLQRR